MRLRMQASKQSSLIDALAEIEREDNAPREVMRGWLRGGQQAGGERGGDKAERWGKLEKGGSLFLRRKSNSRDARAKEGVGLL